MNVLHSIPSIDPSFGGPVAVVRGLCLGLNNLGCKQAIITCSTGDLVRDLSNAESFANTEIIWINPLVRRYYWSPFLKLMIKSKLKGFDICHVHGLFSGISSAVCNSARSLRIPYVLEPFGTLSPYCMTKSSLLKKLSLALGDKKNIECAAGVKFTSEGEFQKFSVNFRTQNGFVAGNGLDWSEFRDLPEASTFRNNCQIADDELIFLFLGRLQPIKGLEVFIPAFLQWTKSRGISARFVIAGPDESGYRSRLEQLLVEHDCTDAVIFTGALYGQDRIHALVDADVVVLPSFHENFGITAAEGMACGKPVLVSDQVDIWPDIKKLDLGEITAINVESIIAAFDRILLRKSDWRAIGLRGRYWAKHTCDWDEISLNVYHKYIEIINK